MKTHSGHTNAIRVREVIGILMESSFYFDLSLRERNILIRMILSS